jgi:site-specific DNA-methyltransferase (adenine-specific)
MADRTKIPDGSVDMILCDLPYGTTRHSWDKCLPLGLLWQHYWRIAKENSAVVLTAQQPFANRLVATAQKFFRYELIWEKPNALGFLNARKMPLRAHENILVFYRKLPKYRPQMTRGKPYHKKGSGRRLYVNGSAYTDVGKVNDEGLRYPRSVLRFSKGDVAGHPTEKPVSLFEWLVRTYTDEGDVVLDNCIGSGTTAVACELSGRRWIGIEKEEKYYVMAKERLRRLLIEENAEKAANESADDGYDG